METYDEYYKESADIQRYICGKNREIKLKVKQLDEAFDLMINMDFDVNGDDKYVAEHSARLKLRIHEINKLMHRVAG